MWQYRPSNNLSYAHADTNFLIIVVASNLHFVLDSKSNPAPITHSGLCQMTISETCKTPYLCVSSIHDQLTVSLRDRSSTLASVRSTVQPVVAFLCKEVVCILTPTELTRQCHLEFLPNPSQTAWS